MHRFGQNHAAETKATPDTTQGVLPIDQIIVGDSAVSVSAQGTSVSTWPHDVQPRGCAYAVAIIAGQLFAPVFFDPQHRSMLDRLKYGNEGGRQKLAAHCRNE